MAPNTHPNTSSKQDSGRKREVRETEREREREKEMGFVMEFAENLIRRLMEDPKERDRKMREHVYAVKERCNKTKEMWSLPIRPYGFWTFERHNSQLAWDAQISQVPGRRDPYDDLLQDTNTK